MKFGLPQLIKFKAKAGAYSPVTPREFDDSQITATDAETELLVDHFNKLGQSIYWGNVSSNPSEALKEFRLFPTGETIGLNLVYPKTLRSELRLYISIRRGFKPEAGDIWFLYETIDDELWIGALKENEWRALFAPGEKGEDEDASPPPTTTTQAVIPVQDTSLIQKRMQLSKYSCEFNETHKLFVARATGCQYVEVHHIIPKRYQAEFWNKGKDLTKLDNLCSLCPWCHRAIHHAEVWRARMILDKLFDLRSIQLHYGISKRDLHQLYSVEEIVKDDDNLSQ